MCTTIAYHGCWWLLLVAAVVVGCQWLLQLLLVAVVVVDFQWLLQLLLIVVSGRCWLLWLLVGCWLLVGDCVVGWLL